jgi:hypothetical protein
MRFHEERVLPLAERHLGLRPEELSLSPKHGGAVERDLDLSAPFGPQRVHPSLRNTQRPLPTKGPLADVRKRRKIGSRHVHRARRQPGDEPTGVGHLGDKPGWWSQRDSEGQSDRRRHEAKPNSPAWTWPRVASGKSRRDSQDQREAGQGERPHVDGGLREDRPPPQERQHEEREARGDGKPKPAAHKPRARRTPVNCRVSSVNLRASTGFVAGAQGD